MRRNKSENEHLILTAVLLAALGLSSAGCGADAGAAVSGEDEATATSSEGESGDEAAGDADEDKAVPVDVAVLERGDIESVLRFSANLEAEDAVEVHAQAARLVTALLVEEGDRVREGQVLARLQDDEQRSELAKVQVELDKARREYQRQQRLHAENLISEQVFNDATFDLEQLELRLADARRELSYTEILAPISGTVTRRWIGHGDPVQVGQHVFDIVDFDSLVARVYVPEKHLTDLAPGIVARIGAPSLERDDYRGRVERVAPIVDPKTGTVKVTVAVGAQPGLRPGLYVDVDLVTAVHEDTLLLPKRALVYDADQMFAFRVDADGRAERVAVRPVLTDKRWIEPADGFSAGDRIVVAGQTGLKPGTRLDARDEGEPAAAAPTAAEAEGDVAEPDAVESPA